MIHRLNLLGSVTMAACPRRQSWLGCLAVSAITVALALSASPAAAQDRPSGNPSVDIAVTSYAAEYDVTHHEAQRRLDRIQPLQDILAEIRSYEAARVAGWGIDHTKIFTGWVWFTGDQPPSTEATAIADSQADVQIRTGATHTLAELLTAQTGLLQDIGSTDHVIGGSESLAKIKRIVTFTDVDMRANAIQIGIDPGLARAVPGERTEHSPIVVSDETLHAKIIEVTQQLRDHMSIKYSVEDGRGISVHADFKGGETMSSCTSGFAAQERSTDMYGLITAGHCFRSNDDPITMHRASLSLVAREWGPDVDAQFRSIPTGDSHRIFDDYICGSGSPCDVRGDISRWKMLNNYLCHHGKNSAESCGTVISVNYSPTHPDSCEATCSSTFVRVRGDTLKTCYGDSGGPWYDRGYAFGIHGGGTGADDCANEGETAYFSAIRDIENDLGVDILTTGPFTVD